MDDKRLAEKRENQLLRRCPFCDDWPSLQEIPAHTHHLAKFMPDHPGSWVIECPCGVGLISENRQEVIDHWNNRPAFDAQAERIKALETERSADRAVCICGCPPSEHESYGEDGEACEHDDHECIRVCVAARDIADGLRGRIKAIEHPDDPIEEAVMQWPPHKVQGLAMAYRIMGGALEKARARIRVLEADIAGVDPPLVTYDAASRETATAIAREAAEEGSRYDIEIDGFLKICRAHGSTL